MTADPVRYIGRADFHDGHILLIVQAGDKMRVTVAGFSGKRFLVCFEAASSIESESPEGMMLYALNEVGGESKSRRQYEFVNWYGDEPSDERAKAHLRIVAKSFTRDRSVNLAQGGINAPSHAGSLSKLALWRYARTSASIDRAPRTHRWSVGSCQYFWD